MAGSPTLHDTGAYLERVGLPAPVDVSADGLERLHRAQLFSIPFENFDIHLGRRLDLSPAGLFRKLVLNPRGGYCFEQNTLFQAVLERMGFDVTALAARVRIRGSDLCARISVEWSHMAARLRNVGDLCYDAG